MLGPDIVFSTTGSQTLRIQNREDGFVIDEIVLSSTTYLRKSPGTLKNDTTTLAIVQPTGVIMVPAGANLQAALNGAKPGDTLMLASGARYVGQLRPAAQRRSRLHHDHVGRERAPCRYTACRRLC